MHLHPDIMYTHISKHVMALINAQLGDVKHQAEVSHGRRFPGVFFVSRRDVRGKLREWVSTEQHRPVKQKVMEESCSDICVRIPTENVF